LVGLLVLAGNNMKLISWTNNEDFDRDGYFILRNLYDPQKLYHPVPQERGQINYYGSLDKFEHKEEETQVNGSLARYSHPQYKEAHTEIRLKVEKSIGRKLYNTYYYDRFYFSGQELSKHTDRDACEISVTLHISSSLKQDWPIYIQTPENIDVSAHLNAGDAMVYKGRERPHWRDAMPGKKKTWLSRNEDYYHQIFFHYVLADGHFAHCAFDMAR